MGLSPHALNGAIVAYSSSGSFGNNFFKRCHYRKTMKHNLLKLAFSLALIGAAAAATAQTGTISYTTRNAPYGGIASARDIGNFPQNESPEAMANDFTNRVVIPMPESFTNNQAAIAADQQYRVQEEGPARGATALQHGSRIEPRPPTGSLSTDPWVEQDHPWEFDNYLAEATSP
jgi:hypothetical protein